jgi:hypothetical protein
MLHFMFQFREIPEVGVIEQKLPLAFGVERSAFWQSTGK